MTGLGDDAVRNAIKKLSELGYLDMQQSRSSGGTFDRTTYTVNTPHIGVYVPISQMGASETPDGDERHPVVQDADNPALSISNLRSIDKIRSNTPLPPCRGSEVVSETNDCSTKHGQVVVRGNSAGEKEKVPPPAARPRRASWPLPPNWDEVLQMNRLPVVPETLKPMNGSEWERRLLAFKVFHDMYPGNKGGLVKEFDTLLKTCHKTKSGIDFVISVLPWGLKYQTELKQKMRNDGGFVPGWQTMKNWIAGCQWESDNSSMSKYRWERAQLNIPSGEYEMYDVRDILPKKNTYTKK